MSMNKKRVSTSDTVVFSRSEFWKNPAIRSLHQAAGAWAHKWVRPGGNPQPTTIVFMIIAPANEHGCQFWGTKLSYHDVSAICTIA